MVRCLESWDSNSPWAMHGWHSTWSPLVGAMWMKAWGAGKQLCWAETCLLAPPCIMPNLGVISVGAHPDVSCASVLPRPPPAAERTHKAGKG